jgi:dehydrogenase/reductase SDR family member 1
MRNDEVALVTGGSRGVGRGIAHALVREGMAVYVTGRRAADADLPAAVVRIPCDHTDDAQVASAFGRIKAEQGRLDVLVNNAWRGYENMVEAGPGRCEIGAGHGFTDIDGRQPRPLGLTDA